MITIVSHDAGGAEILSNYVLQNKNNYQYVLDGPAVSIFSKLLSEINIKSLEETIGNTKLYITGTSWQSEIEKLTILTAKKNQIKVVSFIDHWVNYKERFLYKDQLVLPDEIWVGDEDAFNLAKSTFPSEIVKLKSNPYFESLKSYFKNLKNENHSDELLNILFICENISDHAKKSFNDERYWGYTETDAIEFFFQNLTKLKIKSGSYTFRPHPSDEMGKYDWVLEKYPEYPIQISNRVPLFEQIAKSDLVVGCESMALIVASLANKKVVSCIPPEGKTLGLPQSKIIELRSL
ncbi:MAG: hypothetical protein IBJ01_08080 [Leptospira sp.]|uniref:Uncharacterized protein n=1 Tax=Leptospira paudalimensis TaxID=2950024 RepID=A0ABT3M5P5_9LEPT|nr:MULTISPECIES: hypothetical protein [Leptospira]MBL0954708.1 hypothetical protein [Leptospira sp.]MCW7503711.1 hypothetical protein [Leptospira paudalimensis]